MAKTSSKKTKDKLPKNVRSQKPVREISAGGIVYKRTQKGIRFALMKDSFGKWSFPKGHVEKGEGIEEAAARETLEELGLKEIRLIDSLGKIDIWFRDRFVKKGALIHKDIYYFLFETTADATLEPQVSENILEARWVTPANMSGMSFYRDMDPIIENALSHFKTKKKKKAKAKQAAAKGS